MKFFKGYTPQFFFRTIEFVESGLDKALQAASEFEREHEEISRRIKERQKEMEAKEWRILRN